MDPQPRRPDATAVLPTIARPRRAPRDHPALRLLMLAVCCAAALTLLFGVAVRTERGQRLDQRALEDRHLVDQDARDVARQVLDTITISSLAVAGGGLMFVALARGRVLLAGSVGLAILGANVTTQVLKRMVLERPDLLEEGGRLGNTFPSGHATVAMSLAVGAVLVAPRRWRGTAALAGVAYAVAVATAVLVTGWHRPSDAVAGGLVAVGWGAGVAGLLVAWRGTGRNLSSARPGAPPPVMWILTTAGALLLVAVAVVAVTVMYRGHVGDLVVVERGKALALALAVIVGTDLLLVGLLLVGLRGVTLDPPRLRRAL
jgi:hypothetical protein